MGRAADPRCRIRGGGPAQSSTEQLFGGSGRTGPGKGGEEGEKHRRGRKGTGRGGGQEKGGTGAPMILPREPRSVDSKEGRLVCEGPSWRGPAGGGRARGWTPSAAGEGTLVQFGLAPATAPPPTRGHKRCAGSLGTEPPAAGAAAEGRGGRQAAQRWEGRRRVQWAGGRGRFLARWGRRTGRGDARRVSLALRSSASSFARSSWAAASQAAKAPSCAPRKRESLQAALLPPSSTGSPSPLSNETHHTNHPHTPLLTSPHQRLHDVPSVHSSSRAKK